jgi:hypothetical protein
MKFITKYKLLYANGVFCLALPLSTLDVEKLNNFTFSVVDGYLKIVYLMGNLPVHKFAIKDLNINILVKLKEAKMLRIEEGNEETGFAAIAMNVKLVDKLASLV